MSDCRDNVGDSNVLAGRTSIIVRLIFLLDFYRIFKQNEIKIGSSTDTFNLM